MWLQEQDWDAPGGVANRPVEYPNAIGEEFLDWLRQSTAWRDDVDLVHRRMMKLNRDLREHRERRPVAVAVFPTGYPESETATRMGDPEVVPVVIPPEMVEKAARLKKQRQDNMAKARTARAAKRLAKGSLVA